MSKKDENIIKLGIRRNFARRAGSYDRQACVQRFMAQGLLARLAEALPRSGRLLEIGCGTGYFTHLLKQNCNGAYLVALDLDAALVAAAKDRLGPAAGVAWLVADGETLSRGRFDAIVANASFQWLTRPADSLAAYQRLLNPGGVLAFSTPGPGTFRELADSLGQAASALHLAEAPAIAAQGFLDEPAWAELLARAGFSQVKLAREWVTTTYPSVPVFLKSLQAMGATNPTPRPFSPRLLKALIEAYQGRYGENDAIPVSYEVIWAVARKGSDQ
ncbi:MAG: methyltransferase domain-containing protein [Deltaproteobacteria bacterium]|nr:methyltransferase domain-containing protein [Deltaproteobacteria bacterium]